MTMEVMATIYHSHHEDSARGGRSDFEQIDVHFGKITPFLST